MPELDLKANNATPVSPLRILVMDDEDGIRIALVKLLERLGYEAEAAADGENAVKLFQDCNLAGKPFDLAILDIAIPNGMGGLETIWELKKIDPDIKAIISSGNTTTQAAVDHHELGFCEVLTKPYTLSDLEAAITAAIECDKP